MKKKSVVVTTTAVSLGLATILTVSAVAPSFAKTHKATGTSTSTAAPSWSGSSNHVAPATVSVNFTVTNVPSSYTDAATAAKNLLFKVVPLAADATSAPATAPAPAPAFGAKGAKGAPDNDGDGPGGHGGAWAPSTTAPTTGSTSAPTTSSTAAPTFGDNDGDGPGAKGLGDGDGHGRGHGKGGFGPGNMFSNLTLSNGTLTGTITIPAGRTAGVTKVGVYPFFAADSANSVTAKSGTPVMLTITTVANATTGALTASVTASTGNVSLSLG